MCCTGAPASPLSEQEIMNALSCVIVVALLAAAARAAERPDWAFPPPGATGAPRAPDTGELKRVLGSTRAYTQSQIDSFNDPPDWFPDEHPPMPAIVAHGKGSQVRACISCHLSTGIGHPENSRLAGLPAGYLARQLADFRSGARRGAANMLTFTQAMTLRLTILPRFRSSAGRMSSKPTWRPGLTSWARGACRFPQAGPSRSACGSSKSRKIPRG
jgi:cytochrome c553